MTDETRAPMPESPRLRFHRAGPGDEARLQAVMDAGEPVQRVPPRWQTSGADPITAARILADAAADPALVIAFLVLRETGEDVGAVAWRVPSPSQAAAVLGPLYVASRDHAGALEAEALAAVERWLAERGVRELLTPLRRGLKTHLHLTTLGFREGVDEVQMRGDYEVWRKPLVAQ